MTKEYVFLSGQHMLPFTNPNPIDLTQDSKWDDVVCRYKWAIIEDGEFHGSTASTSCKLKDVKSGAVVRDFQAFDKELTERFSRPQEELLQEDFKRYYDEFHEMYERYSNVRNTLLDILIYLRNKDVVIEQIFRKNKLNKTDFDRLYTEVAKLGNEILETPWSGFARNYDDLRMAEKFKKYALEKAVVSPNGEGFG